MLKKLTIAIPTYGDSIYLAECLGSVGSQTQLVACSVCDGGSKFPFEQNEWNWIHHQRILPDPGIAVCWAAAADASQTEYIAFLADDNLLEPTFAEIMTQFMEATPSCDVVFCNQLFVNQAGESDLNLTEYFTHRYGRHELSEGLIPHHQAKDLLIKDTIPLEACVMRRSVWQQYRFREEAKGALDLDLFSRMVVNGVRFGFISQQLMRFRIQPQSYVAQRGQEHAEAAIWSMSSIETKDPMWIQMLHDKRQLFVGEYLKYPLPWRQSFALSRELMDSPQGLLILGKAIAARLLKPKR